MRWRPWPTAWVGTGTEKSPAGWLVEVAIRRFLEVEPGVPPRQTLAKAFTTANIAVYDRSMFRHSKGRMATTLTISLFRADEVTIGHVGDCRVYLVGGGHIEQVTTDHNFAASQIKLGLLTGQEAADSELRCMLTRCVGKEMTVQPDFYSRPIRPSLHLCRLQLALR